MLLFHLSTAFNDHPASWSTSTPTVLTPTQILRDREREVKPAIWENNNNNNNNKKKLKKTDDLRRYSLFCSESAAKMQSITKDTQVIHHRFTDSKRRRGKEVYVNDEWLICDEC